MTGGGGLVMAAPGTKWCGQHQRNNYGNSCPWRLVRTAPHCSSRHV